MRRAAHAFSRARISTNRKRRIHWVLANGYTSESTTSTIAKCKMETSLFPLCLCDLPLGLVVVLKELARHSLARVVPVEDRVQNARSGVNLVDRRLEIRVGSVSMRLLQRVLVVDPATEIANRSDKHGKHNCNSGRWDVPRVDRIHVNVACAQILCACTRHHVERSLGHVGVRVVGRLVAIKLAFHGADVHDELLLFS